MLLPSGKLSSRTFDTELQIRVLPRDDFMNSFSPRSHLEGTHRIRSMKPSIFSLSTEPPSRWATSRKAASLWQSEAIRHCFPSLPGVSVHRRFLPRHDVASSDMKVDMVKGSLQDFLLTGRFIARFLEVRKQARNDDKKKKKDKMNACFITSPSFPRKCVGKSAKYCKSKEKNLWFSALLKPRKSSLFSVFSRKGGGLGTSQCNMGVRFYLFRLYGYFYLSKPCMAERLEIIALENMCLKVRRKFQAPLSDCIHQPGSSQTMLVLTVL